MRSKALALPAVGLFTGTAALLAALALPSAAESSPGALQDDILPGLFTAAQADRGRTLYQVHCAACHGSELQGVPAPALRGPRFEASWSHPEVTLDDMFYIQRTTMPPRGIGNISEADHAAVFAFVLQANGYPASEEEIAVGAAGLKQPTRWVGQYQSTFSVVPASGGSGAAPEFIAGAPGAAPATSGPDQQTLTDAARSTDWLYATHDYSGTRFSPLDGINTSNAASLAPACVFQLGETDNFQTNPIVHRGTMYITTWRSTIALDAATCRVKWRHRWEPKGDTVWERNRGVAIKDGRLIRGTPDGYLVSLNSATGDLLWARRVADASRGETFTMPPLVFEDLVIIGPAGSENNIQGWVGAFRVSDGTPVWRFNTVPQEGEPGFETWHSPAGIPMGGAAVWTPLTIDPETGDLHVAATNPAPDLPVHLRQGDNLYTNSIVALDVRTGKLRWHRSMLPNDSHDWDLSHAGPLFALDVDGSGPKQLVATVGKEGVLRTLDRATRKVLYETPVTTLENADRPVTTTPKYTCPGMLGGVEWNGPAFNPDTRMLYVNAVDWCATFTAFEDARYIPGKMYIGGTTDFDPPAKAQGWLTAVDAATGEVRWKYRSARPLVAAVTTTAGNLVFTGELTGDFLALDGRSGDVLYRFNTGGPMGGGIATYEVDGTQYVAAVSGSPSSFWVLGNPGAPTLVVFKLQP
jgi:alcohol dehydrogenase (cytochrome c)